MNFRSLFHTLVLGKGSTTPVQFLRNGAVGAVSIVVYLAVSFLLHDVVGLFYIVSAIIGYSVGIVVNYILTVMWVFDFRRFSDPRHEQGIFLAIQLLGLCINTALVWLFSDIFGMSERLALVVAPFIVFIYNFIAKKYILFSKRGESDGGPENPSEDGKSL